MFSAHSFLLFFINDITDDLPSHVKAKLFTDDLKIYTELSFTNTSADFQKQLDYIFTWAITWQINISYTKCNTLEISKHPTTTKYTISTNPIPPTKIIKDLGITMQNDLKFTNHISDIITRANQRAALIYRCFLSRNTTNLIRAYKTYVRPLLEYGTVIWSPSLIHLITNIESVQRRYTKRLPGFKNLTYADRLIKLKIQSLEQRRLITDLVTCFSIVRGFSSIQFSDLFKFIPQHSTRGHNYRLQCPLIKKQH